MIGKGTSPATATMARKGSAPPTTVQLEHWQRNQGRGNGANFWPYMFRSQPIRWLDLPEQKLGRHEYLTDRLNHEAVQFIEHNRDKPFFLFLSHYAPHTILNGKPQLVAKYRKKHAPGKSTRERCYLCQDAALAGDPQNHWAGDHNPHLAAMLESIDDGVGQITAKLKALGLDKYDRHIQFRQWRRKKRDFKCAFARGKSQL